MAFATASTLGIDYYLKQAKECNENHRYEREAEFYIEISKIKARERDIPGCIHYTALVSKSYENAARNVRGSLLRGASTDTEALFWKTAMLLEKASQYALTAGDHQRAQRLSDHAVYNWRKAARQQMHFAKAQLKNGCDAVAINYFEKAAEYYQRINANDRVAKAFSKASKAFEYLAGLSLVTHNIESCASELSSGARFAIKAGEVKKGLAMSIRASKLMEELANSNLGHGELPPAIDGYKQASEYAAKGGNNDRALELLIKCQEVFLLKNGEKDPMIERTISTLRETTEILTMGNGRISNRAGLDRMNSENGYYGER